MNRIIVTAFGRIHSVKGNCVRITWRGWLFVYDGKLEVAVFKKWTSFQKVARTPPQ